MTRKLYSSLEAIEEAALFPDDNQELRLLLRQHALVIVDTPAEELSAQEDDPESILAALLRSEGNAFVFDALPDWQLNPEALLAGEAAGALFVLNRDPAECEKLSKKHGVCVVSHNAVSQADYLLKPLARRELLKTDTYQSTEGGNLRRGWYAALTVPEMPVSKVPLNALVIIDTYLFGDKGRFVDAGKENLVGLLQALLPATLDIDFHLLLVSTNSINPFEKKSFAAFSKDVVNRLDRPYAIQIGLVTRPSGGKERRSITGNYYFCTSQHGFCCFSNAKPDYNNDFIASGAFEGANNPGFHLPVRSMTTELKTAKKLITDNLARENAPGSTIDPLRRCLGFYQNRLLGLIA